MSLITPVPGQRSFECCEVATINQNGGPGACRVWLLNGDTITYAVAAATVAALVVNADGDPLLYGPFNSPTFGSQPTWMAAQNVAQLRQLAAVPPQTLITMNGGPGNFVVPVLEATLIPALNLIARCGGGGAPPSQVYVNSAAEWTPTFTSGTGNTPSTNGAALWSRIAPFGSAEPGAGDWLQLQLRLQVIVTLGNTVSFSINDVPFDIPNGGLTATVSVSRQSGDAFEAEELRINRSGANAISVQSPNYNMLANTTFFMDLVVTFPVDAA